jgi:hypothetical protein
MQFLQINTAIFIFEKEFHAISINNGLSITTGPKTIL